MSFHFKRTENGSTSQKRRRSSTFQKGASSGKHHHHKAPPQGAGEGSTTKERRSRRQHHAKKEEVTATPHQGREKRSTAHKGARATTLRCSIILDFMVLYLTYSNFLIEVDQIGLTLLNVKLVTSTSFHFIQKKGERQHHPKVVEEGTTTKKEEEGKAVLLQRRLGKQHLPKGEYFLCIVISLAFKKLIVVSLTYFTFFFRLKRKLVTSISLHVIQKKKGDGSTTQRRQKNGAHSTTHKEEGEKSQPPKRKRKGKQHHPLVYFTLFRFTLTLM